MNKILVTGSNGFIGQELTRQLIQKNFNVIGVDIKKNKLIKSKYLKSIILDLSKKKISNIKNVDVIVHLSATVGDNFFNKNFNYYYLKDIQSLLNILQFASKNKVKNFVFASSEWVYGDNKNSYRIFENKPLLKNSIQSFYGLSKIISENLIKTLYLNKKIINYVILRFSIVYGKRKKPGSAVEGIFTEIKNNNKIIINGSKNSSRRFINVKDLCNGIVKAIKVRKPNIINLSSNQLISLKNIIDISQKILKKKVKIHNINRNNLVIRNIDNSKAKKILKWKPKVNIINGIKELNNS
jgi:nucleoside-diphosphate-sugar epimerase